jgi:hypothetical protein
MLVSVAVAGCASWKDFDKSSSLPADYWKKSGYSWNETNRVLWQECGYKNDGWTLELQERVDVCMLEKGFSYTNLKWAGYGPCDIHKYKNLPSCQSLKKIRE